VRRMSDEKEENEEYEQSINQVQIDGLALLKIIKHCKESLPEIVTGSLLGLDIDKRLEITNAFPYPVESEGYQEAMMKCLRVLNVDNNTVGWYQSSILGNFLTADFIEGQLNHQRAIPSSVVLVVDPARTASGRLALKAYRLTRDFIKSWNAKKVFNPSSRGASDILEELPIKVHNSHLVHGYLYELREQKQMSCDFDRLNLTASGLLEKNLENLSRLIDDYGQEQSKFQYYQRMVARQKGQQAAYLQRIKQQNEEREAQGKDPLPSEDLSKNSLFKPIPKPSRLEASLLSKQISHHCSQINSTTVQTLHKMYVVDALQKSK